MWRALGGAELPEELAEKAEPVVQIRWRERQMADQAANFCLHGGRGGAMRVAVEGERLEEKGDQSFFFSGGGERGFGGGGFWIFWAGLANEFVENDGDGLAEVHGEMARLLWSEEWDCGEQRAVAEMVVGEAGFF